MLICVFTGFSSGLPLYVLLTLVPGWLRSEHVDLKAIGLFTLIQFPYTWKFLWSPLLDRFAFPLLGRRRGWMLVTQSALLLSISLIGGLVPGTDLRAIAGLAALTAFLSASQDIVLDAYRREILSDAELGLGTAVHVNAYKIAGLIPGSLALVLADYFPWPTVFLVTALFMLPGMAMTLLVQEPAVPSGAPRTLRAAVVEPFAEFLGRAGWRGAALVLGFIFLYKLGDSMATALATPFYLDMGFTKSEIGLIAKNAGLWPSVFGGCSADCGWSSWASTARCGCSAWCRHCRSSGSRSCPSSPAAARPWPAQSASKRSEWVWGPQRSPRSSRVPPTRATPRRSSRCLPAWRRCRAR